MHFDILIEDQSGKKVLKILVPNILGKEHTFTIKAYKGIGRIPKNMKAGGDPAKRALLNQLPRLLQGYGKTYAGYPDNYQAAVILICDLDDQDRETFHKQLAEILTSSDYPPEARFCFAIEEGEAWLLGDIPAIKTAYPTAKKNILSMYVNDSICGTWEKLADAVYSGGSKKLTALGYQQTGAEKSTWARRITPHMDVENNRSPSFVYFRDVMRDLTKEMGAPLLD